MKKKIIIGGILCTFVVGCFCGFQSKGAVSKDNGNVTVYPYIDTNGMEYLIVVQDTSRGYGAAGGVAITLRLKDSIDNKILYKYTDPDDLED